MIEPCARARARTEQRVIDFVDALLEQTVPAFDLHQLTAQHFMQPIRIAEQQRNLSPSQQADAVTQAPNVNEIIFGADDDQNRDAR